MATRIATVIGNGESRKGFDIKTTKLIGMTVGCNAVYRDMDPNFIVCADKKMIYELLRERDNRVPYPLYTRPQWIKSFNKFTFLEMPKLPYEGKAREDNPFHWGAGGFATLVALANSHAGWLGKKPETVFLLGFDLYGSGKQLKYHNNIYKDTENYWATDRHAVPHHYWVYQISKILEHHPNVNFFQVNHAKWEIPKTWEQLANFNFITIDEFSQFIVDFQQQKILKDKEAIINDLKRRT